MQTVQPALRLLCVLALVATAARTEPSAAQTSVFQIDRTTLLAPQDHIALAQLGRPISTVVSQEALRRDPRQAVADSVAASCGSRRSSTVQQNLVERAMSLNRELLNRIRALNPFAAAASATQTLSGEGVALRNGNNDASVAIQVPFCVGETSQTVAAQQGDTINSVLRRFYDDAPAGHYASIYAANQAFFEQRRGQIPQCANVTDGEAIVACLNDRIQAGDRFALPRAAPVGLLISPEDSERLLSRIHTTALVTQLRSQARPPSGIRLVHAVDPALADTPYCSASVPSQFPFDSADIWRRVQEQRALQAQAHATARSAIVGLIDTGVSGPDSTNLPPAFFARRVDDSGEPVIDEFGQSIHLDGNIRPFENDPEGSHGTEISDIITGGAAFRTGVGDAAALSPIRLRVYSLATGRNEILTPESATRGVNYLLDPDALRAPVRAQIVNLSFEQSDGAEDWETILRGLPPKYAHADALFIVAAGNGREDPRAPRYLEAPNDRVWPSAWGGENLANVITVAATDRAGRLAPFSNYGSNVVELAAPGCQLSLFDQHFSPQSVSGTSFAAPQATFAAAMISSLSIVQPTSTQIKQRLIYSADFSPALAEDVRLGATLNIARAISVNSDVLTLEAPPQAGSLRTPAGLARICPNEMLDAVARRFIATRLGANRFRIQRYFVNGNGIVSVHTCASAILPTGALMFVSGGSTEDLSQHDRFDLLLRDAPPQ